MIKQLKQMIQNFIENRSLNCKIIKDDEDLFLINIFYGKESDFSYSFVLNKTTPMWNDCGFFGLYDDEFRPMTEEGLNELFEIADKCIKYGICIKVIKNDKVSHMFKMIDLSYQTKIASKDYVIEILKQNEINFDENFDLIQFENFKKDIKIIIKKDELEKIVKSN